MKNLIVPISQDDIDAFSGNGLADEEMTVEAPAAQTQSSDAPGIFVPMSDEDLQAFAGAKPNQLEPQALAPTYDNDPGAWARIKRGVATSFKSSQVSGLGKDIAELENRIQWLDNYEKEMNKLNPNYGELDPKVKADFEAEKVQIFAEIKDLFRRVADKQLEIAQIPVDPDTAAFQNVKLETEDWEGFKKSLGDLWDRFSEDPAGITADTVLQSSIPSLKGLMTFGIARVAGAGRWGSAAVGGMTTGFEELGSDYVQLRKEGVDHETAWQQAMVKSGVIGLFDTASMGLLDVTATKIAGSKALGKVGAGLVQTGREAGLGGGGEGLGSLASGRAPEPAAIASEMLGEGGFTPANIAGAQFAQSDVPGNAAEKVIDKTGKGIDAVRGKLTGFTPGGVTLEELLASGESTLRQIPNTKLFYNEATPSSRVPPFQGAEIFGEQDGIVLWRATTDQLQPNNLALPAPNTINIGPDGQQVDSGEVYRGQLDAENARRQQRMDELQTEQVNPYGPGQYEQADPAYVTPRQQQPMTNNLLMPPQNPVYVDPEGNPADPNIANRARIDEGNRQREARLKELQDRQKYPGGRGFYEQYIPGEAYGDQDYLPNLSPQERVVSELAQAAIESGASWDQIGRILAQGSTDSDIIAALEDIINNNGAGNEPANQVSTASQYQAATKPVEEKPAQVAPKPAAETQPDADEYPQVIEVDGVLIDTDTGEVVEPESDLPSVEAVSPEPVETQDKEPSLRKPEGQKDATLDRRSDERRSNQPEGSVEPGPVSNRVQRPGGQASDSAERSGPDSREDLSMGDSDRGDDAAVTGLTVNGRPFKGFRGAEIAGKRAYGAGNFEVEEIEGGFRFVKKAETNAGDPGATTGESAIDFGEPVGKTPEHIREMIAALTEEEWTQNKKAVVYEELQDDIAKLSDEKLQNELTEELRTAWGAVYDEYQLTKRKSKAERDIKAEEAAADKRFTETLQKAYDQISKILDKVKPQWEAKNREKAIQEAQAIVDAIEDGRAKDRAQEHLDFKVAKFEVAAKQPKETHQGRGEKNKTPETEQKASKKEAKPKTYPEKVKGIRAQYAWDMVSKALKNVTGKEKAVGIRVKNAMRDGLSYDEALSTVLDDIQDGRETALDIDNVKAFYDAVQQSNKADMQGAREEAEVWAKAFRKAKTFRDVYDAAMLHGMPSDKAILKRLLPIVGDIPVVAMRSNGGIMSFSVKYNLKTGIKSEGSDRFNYNSSKLLSYAESGLFRITRDSIDAWVSHAITHEAIHAAATILDANSQELTDLRQAVVSHFRNATLSEEERGVLRNMTEANAEIIAYGMTDPVAQRLLSQVSIGSESGFTKFVKAIMKLLGIDPSQQTALTEAIRIADDIFTQRESGSVELRLLTESEKRQAKEKATQQDLEVERVAKPKAQKPRSDFGKDNKLVSQERSEELKKKLKEKLLQNKYSGLDPELVAIGTELTVFYLEGGVRKFGEFAQRLIDELEVDLDRVRPYLRGWYNAARDMMEDNGLDVSDMDSPDQVKDQLGQLGKQESPSKTIQIDAIWDAIESDFDNIKNNNDLKRLVAGIMRVKQSDVEPKDLKVAQEVYESVLVSKAAWLQRETDAEKFQAYVDMYNAQPSLNVRSSTSMENQAYSTPAPLSFVAQKLAGIDHGTKLYEPTAGNGMLAFLAKPSNVTANELNELRASLLREAQIGTVTQNNATEWTPGSKEFDATIMNPPFGRLRLDDGRVKYVEYDGYKISKLDHLIAAKALETIKDGGTASIIIGADKVAGQIGSADRIFFNWLYSNYNVVDHFEVDGKLYSRQGASWPVRVITVAGRVESDSISPKSGTIPRFDTWAEVWEHYEATKDAIKQPVDSRQSGGAGAEDISGSRTNGGVNNEPGRSGVGNDAQADGATGKSSKPKARSDADSRSSRDGQRGNDAEGSRRGDGGKLADGQSDNSRGTTDARSADTGRQEGTPKRDAAVSNDKPRKQPVANKASSFQSTYEPLSKNFNDGVLIPVNMKEPMKKALASIQDAVGDVDAYVKNKLGYTSQEEYGKAFMALQVDSIAAAIYNHEAKNKGIIIADQTGVGKGRQAAGILRYAKRAGMVPVFITEKPNLFTDMYNDLADIGEKDIKPFIFNAGEGIKKKNKYGKIVSLFKQGGKARDEAISQIAQTGMVPDGYNAIFLTYSQLGTDNVQRKALKALKDKALFVLDEAHNVAGQREERVKNGKRITGAGIIYEAIKDRPVTYLSATYAKNPDNMPIFYRTDIVDAVDKIEDIAEAVASGGAPLQQVMSAMLVEAGQLFRRERSFDGIEFPVNVDTESSQEHRKIADQVNEGLRAIVEADKLFHDVFVGSAKDEAEATGGIATGAGNRASSTVDHSNFNSVVHNYTRQLLLALKADKAADTAIAKYKQGIKPTVGVENTMASFIERFAMDEGISPGEPFTATYRDILLNALKNSRRLSVEGRKGVREKVQIELSDLDPLTRRAYEEAEETINNLDLSGLPISPIDYIRNKLEQAGIKTGEITGRYWGIDYSTSPPTLYKRSQKEVKDRNGTIDGFNTGSINALVLNVAGSTGLSIHASEKASVTDKRPRHMIIAQPMGDINKLVQLLGRINRTGQVALPTYEFLALDLPTEKRPMAVTSKKMTSLTSQTSANDKSDTSLNAVDFINKYGDQVVRAWLAQPENAKVAYLTRKPDSALAFTGRISVLPIAQQESIYEEIEAEYTDRINYLDKIGQNDLVATTLDLQAEILDSKIVYEGKSPGSIFGGNTTLHKVRSKLIGKAPNAQDVQQAVDSFKAEHGSFDDFVGKLMDSMKPAASAFSAELNDSTTQAIAAVNDLIKKQEAAEKGSPEYQKIGKKLTAAKERANRAGQATHDFLVQQGTYQRIISEFPVGSIHALDFDGTKLVGTVSDIKVSKTSKGNPYAPSKTKIRFLVNSGIYDIDVPLSQIREVHISDMSRNTGYPAIYDRKKGEDLTEIRYIATGNLIMGSKKLKGRIVNFTDKDGKQRQGILMPSGYEDKAFDSVGSDSDIPLRSHGVAMKLLRDNRAELGRLAGIFNASKAVKLKPKGENSWVIEVPKSNADKDGYSVKFDEQLRAIMGTDFHSSPSGGVMTASFGDPVLPEVLDRLMELQQLYALPSMRGAFESAGGQKKSEAKKTFDESETITQNVKGFGQDGYNNNDAENDLKKLLGDPLFKDLKNRAREQAKAKRKEEEWRKRPEGVPKEDRPAPIDENNLDAILPPLEEVLGRAEMSLKDQAKLSLEKDSPWEAIKANALKTITLRQLVSIGKKYLPQLEKYLDIVHVMMRDRNVLAEKAAKIVEPWQKWAARNRGMADKLHDLIHDATLSMVDPSEDFLELTDHYRERIKVLHQRQRDLSGDPQRINRFQNEVRELEAMIKNEPQRKLDHARLSKEWKQLSPEAQEIYRKVRDEYKERHDRMKAILLKRIEDAEIHDEVRRMLLAKMKFDFQTKELQGPYFPLARFGRYWLSVADENGEPAFLMYETEGEVKRAVKALEESGYAKNRRVRYGMLTDNDMNQDGASLSFINDVIQKIEEAEINDKKAMTLMDEVYQLYLDTLPARSIGKQNIHRKGIKGFSRNAIRAFADQMMRNSYQLARMAHQDDLSRLMIAMKKEKGKGGIEQGRLYNEMQTRHEWVMNPGGAAWAQKLTGIGFVWMLGVSPAAALVNITQTPTVAWPVMFSKLGMGAVTKTLGLVTKFNWRTGSIDEKHMSSEDILAFNEFKAMGLLDDTYAHDLAGLAEHGGYTYSNRQEKLMRVISAPFHRAEQFNREVTALAAFRQARENGMDFNEAVKVTADIVWDSHFDYTNVNRAPFMQSNFAKVALQFRQFSQNMTYYLARNAYKLIMRSKFTPDEKKLAFRQLVGTLGITALMAGSNALPLWAVFKIIESFMDDDEDDPFDARYEFHQYLADVYGKEAANRIVYGFGGAGLSNRVSLDGLWIRSPWRDMETEDSYTYYMMQALGPVFGGVGLAIVKGMSDIGDGHVWRGFEGASPKFIKDPMKALRYADEGALSWSGNPYKEAGDFTTLSLVMQASGFADAGLMRTYAENAAINTYSGRLKERRRRLLTNYYLSWKEGDKDEMQDTLAQIQKFNRKNPRIRITSDTLKRSVKSRERYARDTINGIKLDKTLRYLAEEMDIN